MHTSVKLIAVGICMEIFVVLAGVALKQGWNGQGWLARLEWMSDSRYHGFHEINSVLGLISSFVLIYGVLSFVKGLQISRSALKWAYASCLILIVFKAFDVFNTVFTETADAFFASHTFLDGLLYNILIAGGCFSILIGLMRALYDANGLNIDLEERNILLDREIRERRDTEEQAVAQEGQFSTILNALSSPAFLVSRDGHVLAHTREFAQMWGLEGENLVGKHMSELVSEPVYAEGMRRALQVFDRAGAATFTWTLANRTYDVQMYPVGDKAGEIPSVTVLGLDITEKLHDEEERRLLEAAVNNAAESVFITDVAGRIVYVNPAFELQTGYSREEVTGLDPSFLADCDTARKAYAEIWPALKAGEVWRGRLTERRKDGERINQSMTVSPVRDKQGKVTHFIFVERNITRELRLEQHLHRAQKLEALGTMAGGVAHDMKNVFAIVLGRSEIAIPSLEEGHPARACFQIIMKTVTSSTKLMKRLLTFARRNTGELTPLCIASLIGEQVRFVNTYLPSNIKVIPRIGLAGEIIVAEPSEIQQAFVNLVNNANFAMQPGGGILEITLDAACPESELLLTTGVLPPGNYVRLRISDTGCGMDRETQHRMFDPFFTTKAPGEGTGLGLPMVHGTVLNSGGQIQVESEPGRGTSIEIYWPQAAPGTAIREDSRHEAVSGDGISVMVIDDMADFKDLLALNLKSHGFKVTAFEDAAEALCKFAEDPTVTDVVVVDYMMPGMNGEQLAREMHALRPDLPVILLSGYASGITNENAREHGFCAMFDKPLEMSKLSRLLVQMVPRPHGSWS